jgi:hypothetical protein
VIASANNAGKTQIQCSETQQIHVGDTVRITGTSNLDGSWPVQSIDSRVLFTINLAFPGALTPGSNGTGLGVFISEHTINTVGNTFTDNFQRGDCIGIYRIN